ncbi:MAG: hypothetical protein LWW85_04415 [Marinilabiliales bacterium]|nr:hypothetical protein [Marinilabiliales bacterium]
MASSFGTVLQKLRLTPEMKVLVMNAPEEFLSLFGDRKPDLSFSEAASGSYDAVLIFGVARIELNQRAEAVRGAGRYDAIFWACYPKGGGKISSDLKRERVWETLQLAGLRPVSQVAIDETWSALRGRPEACVGK